MSRSGVKTVQGVQLIALAVLLAWALSVASGIVRRHWPIGPSDLPSGSYMTVSTPIQVGHVKTTVLSALRELALDIRIGG